jgi:hypothetical protein
VKHTEEEHQPEHRVNPRRYKKLIDVQRLNDRPFAAVVAERLKPRERHPDEKDPHTQGILPSHSRSSWSDDKAEQSRNRPLTKGTTWVQHNDVVLSSKGEKTFVKLSSCYEIRSQCDQLSQ